MQVDSGRAGRDLSSVWIWISCALNTCNNRKDMKQNIPYNIK